AGRAADLLRYGRDILLGRRGRMLPHRSDERRVPPSERAAGDRLRPARPLGDLGVAGPWHRVRHGRYDPPTRRGDRERHRRVSRRLLYGWGSRLDRGGLHAGGAPGRGRDAGTAPHAEARGTPAPIPGRGPAAPRREPGLLPLRSARPPARISVVANPSTAARNPAAAQGIGDV